ncbi:MAG: magnesium/cobalt transporter CorA [Clostridia bacterium]|nr:magnesium/cobalt transporter CorA [Clostridia bacterium]
MNSQTNSTSDVESIQYTGSFTADQTVLDLIKYQAANSERKNIHSLEEAEDPSKNVWLNITGLNDFELLQSIGEKYSINRLVLEDIVHVDNYPKIEIYDTYIFAIVKMVYLKDGLLFYEHVSIILSKDMLITFQETQGDVFGAVRNSILIDKGTINTMGLDYLFYSLIDSIIDNYFVVLEKIDLSINALEDKILDEQASLTGEIYNIRREILRLKTSFSPIKEVLNLKKHRQSSLINESVYIYFEDLRGQIDQVVEAIGIQKETINGLYEMHVANISNKMNSIMTTLTIFSAIFIPLSFLAGVFGMNFHVMPGLNNPYGFSIFMGGSLLISASMIVFFKRNKWF